MKVLLLLFRYSRRTVIWAIVAGLVSGMANTGLLALINALLTGSKLSRTALLWAFVGLCVLVPLTRIASELLLTYLGQGTIYQMRMDMCRRILTVPLRQLEVMGAPRLLSALTGDIPTITQVVTVLPVLFINAAILIGSLVYLGVLSWKVLLAVSLFVVLGVVGYQLPLRRATEYFRRGRDVRDDLYGHFRAVTDGTKELKLHYRRRRSFLDRTLASTAADYRLYQIRGQTVYTIASSWGQLLVFVAIGLLLLVAPGWRGPAAGASTLTGFTLVLLYLMTPLQVIMNTLPNLGQAEVALDRVQKMGLDLAAHASEDGSAAPDEGGTWKTLELSGITHVYHREGEDHDFVLGPIDLRLSPGELVFIAGGNGSGKTTLAKVLVGLYPPQNGAILFDGEPVTDANREAFRQHFSVVFSDFYLFDELVGLEAPELDERARFYLQELQISHKVEVKDGKLSTTSLSQGQRKRLALLTAYLEDRPIYLFDEWAADQDPLFKEIFYLQMLPELKRRGKTVIAISHDDRYYLVGDRVVKLEYGRLSEEARPAEAIPAPAVGPTRHHAAEARS